MGEIFSGRRFFPSIALAISFAGVYALVDWMSFVHSFGALNITPWNPPAALDVLLLMWRGISWAPWVYASLAFSDWLVRDANVLSASVMVGNLVLVVCYSVLARSLVKIMSSKTVLQDREDVVKLCVISSIGAAVTAFLYVNTQIATGILHRDAFIDATYRFFIGDLLGLIVVLPLCLLLKDPVRRQQFLFMFKQTSYWILTVGLMICMGFVFSLPADEQRNYFFPFFFAVGLIGAAHSLPASTLAAALVQIPLIWSATRIGVTPSVLIDMQIAMLTLSLTGLIIGTVVDERLKIQEKLKESLQLVAAGELAGSIAHELNQPMNALNAYAESALIISSSPSNDGNENMEKLRAVIKQITVEIARASDIVKGLRGFFIDGASRIAFTDVKALTADCCALLRPFAEGACVRLIFEPSKRDFFCLIDQTQIRTALGNIIKNAVEAAADSGEVRVELREASYSTIEILVFDTGSPLGAVQGVRIFKPFFSTKTNGLGLGLSISKSLIENNEGTLEYREFPQKHFRITLPVEP